MHDGLTGEIAEKSEGKSADRMVVNGNKDALASVQVAGDPNKVRQRPPHGKGGFTLIGSVRDEATGRVIAGAKVEDDGYAGNETTVASNGSYEYRTWAKEHYIKASAKGYESKRILFKPSLMQHSMFGQLKFKLKRIKRLEYNLRPVKKVWQIDEYPAFILDVKNVSSFSETVGHFNLRMISDNYSYRPATIRISG